MRIPDPVLHLLLAAALALLAGCHEYHVTVDLAADGSGSRTTTLEAAKKPSPAAQHLLGLDGGAWKVTTSVDHEGAETYRYRRQQRVADLAEWPAAGGLVLRAAADAAVDLNVAVTVEETRDADGRRLVYRETLSWNGLQEAVAAQAAADYAGFLRRQFPDLPDSLVEESRAVLAATVNENWMALTGDEEKSGSEVDMTVGPEKKLGADPESKLDALFNPPQEERLSRAGVDPDTVRRIARTTTDRSYFEGVKAAMPGLDGCFRSIYNLTVVMPAPVTGGNADEIAGDKATFRVELSSTLAAPVTLEAVCRP